MHFLKQQEDRIPSLCTLDSTVVMTEVQTNITVVPSVNHYVNDTRRKFYKTRAATVSI
jgi:hypothetical protein